MTQITDLPSAIAFSDSDVLFLRQSDGQDHQMTLTQFLARILRFEKYVITLSGGRGPFVLPQTPNGLFQQLLIVGIINPDSSYTISGNEITFTNAIDPTLVIQATFIFSF